MHTPGRDGKRNIIASKPVVIAWGQGCIHGDRILEEVWSIQFTSKP